MACSCSKTCCCEKSVAALSKLLANSYVLFLKTQNIHWNVVGSSFRAIHLMTEEHYNDLFAAIDVIAERIRMVGEKSPATFDEFKTLASVNDILNSQDASGMIRELLEDHITIANDIREGLKSLDGSSDFATLDVLNSRLSFHEKISWMLKSTISNI